MKFTILHTNDIHSRFENFAKICTKIKEIRDENTILLDAGDFSDFMRLEVQGTLGKAGSELLDIAGYDAITLGNNEGFAGIEVLENLTKGDSVPYLSCNLYGLKNECDKVNKHSLIILNRVKRSIIIKRNGMKFLIIGSSPYGELNKFYHLSGLHSSNAVEEIKMELEKNKDNYDICILLSHCGMIEDTDIANSVEGIDIIINGHSHILMDEAVKINNSIIHMSGCYGEHLGKLTFEYSNGRITNYKGSNININNVSEDTSIIESLSKSKEAAIKKLNETLYEIKENLWHDIVEENPISNLLADSLKHVLNSDIGIINSGILNGGIEKGTVTKKKLLEICPSPLNPTLIKVLGKDIKEALEKSLDANFCMKDGKGSGFRGKYLGRLHIAGAYIQYHDKNIVKIVINNKELEEDKWYLVATSDYIERGTGYESFKNNILEKYNPEYIRDVLEEYLRKDEFVSNSNIHRWIRV